MEAGKFVLQNRNGETIRTFTFEDDAILLIYRHDTRRVEAVSEVKSLDAQEIGYDVLKKSTAAQLKKRAVTLGNGASFRWVQGVDKTVSLINVKDDSEEQAKAIYKKTAFTQLGAMLFILIVGLLIEPFFTPKKEEPVVTIIPRQFIQKKEQVTVKASETKVNPETKVAKKRVDSQIKKISKVLTAKVKAVRKENAPLRTKIQVENVGALGVLGGMKSGSKNSAGFNVNAINDSRGTSWNGAGAGGVGGMERAIPGKGLVASAMGRGGQVEGGGGYGTRGKAGGGRPGYGEMGMGGTAAAYFEPVQEEALVEGGLDKDQIAAVINRHIGEVIYCYEKGLQQKAGLSGRVGVKFLINGQGDVASANVNNSSLGNAEVEGCITNRLRGWKFPKPVGGVNVKVQYPFVLKRVSHG